MATNRTETWLRKLKENGYRLTASRKAVVEVITSSQFVLSPLQVYELARKRYQKLGLVTVYRTIDKLVELNLIQRVHQPSGCQGFVPASIGHQHLLICTECGIVSYFSGENESINPLVKNVENSSGYSIKSHWFQLFGICSDCQIPQNTNSTI